MAGAMGSLTVREDPLLEQKEQQIRDLQDENLSLRQELESLRVGWGDGPTPRGMFGVLILEPKTPLAERKMKVNGPGSVRSVSKKLLFP
jgi:hypothetical protein